MTKVELNPKYASNLHLRDMRANTYQAVSQPLLSESDSKKLTDTIKDLFKTVAIDRKRGTWNYELSMDMRGFCVPDEYNFIVSDEFALAFFKFYKAISAGTYSAFEDGKNKGGSLLIGLNDGTYTVNDFNERIKKENKPINEQQ